MKRLLGLLCALLFSVPAFADQCNMLPSMDTWSNGGTQSWVPTLYTTQKTFSFPITLLSGSIEGGYKNIPVKLVKVKPNTKYTLYTDVSASSSDKFGWEYAGYKTEADAYGNSSVNVNSNATFSQGSNNIRKTVTFTTTADTEYLVVSPTNWGSGASVTLTAESKIIMVEGDSITNTNIPRCGATTSNSLPSGYQQLEYLESTGTQWIDTGVKFTSGSLVIDADVYYTNAFPSGSQRMFVGNGVFGVGVYQTNRAYTYAPSQNANTALSTVTGVWHHFIAGEDETFNYLTVDGVAANTTSHSTDGAYSQNNIELFAGGNSGAWFRSGNGDRLKTVKMTINGTLVRDFVPARRVSDGVLGMYDLADSNANTAFHTNAGTGTFIAGPTIIPNTFERLQYIESTGTQYIDTGIVGNQDTKVDIDFVVTGGPGTQFWPFGSRTDSNQAAFAIWGSSGTVGSTFRVGFDGTQGYSGNEITQNTRYHVISSKEGIYMNGTLGYTPTGYSSFTTPSNLMLFAAYNRGTVQTGTNMQLFSCSLYDNGTLSFNGVPVKRLSDGEVGMFDTVTGNFLTNSGTGDFVAGPSAVMKIATTKYNNAAFSPVVTALSNAVDTIKTVVANTINQATAVANLHSGKQTKPTDTCPNGKICLLVEDEAGTPHWYEIIERAPGIVPAGSGYTQVEYLQSSGTQYIDTGIQDTARLEMRMNLTAYNDNYTLLYGSQKTSSPVVRRSLVGVKSTKSINESSGSTNQETNAVSSADVFTTNAWHDITAVWSTNPSVTLDGVEYVAPGTSDNASTGLNDYLFSYSLGGASSYNMKAKVAYARVYDANGVLVRDFVPARRNSDGVLGMYDTVSGNFFTNAGTGKFYAPDQYVPSAYTRLEYIESTGTQWIDTGLTTGKFVHDIAFTTVSNDNLMGNSAGAGFYWGQRRNASGNGYELATRYITGMNSTERRVVEYDNLDSAKILSAGGQTVTYSVSGAAGNNYILFRIYNSDQYYVNAKLWGFQAYDANGKIVRDMVPAKRNSDNEVGLYDNVNDVFYTNQGSGEFYAPGDRTLPAGYTKLQYIESTGTQEIDTGVLPSAVDDIYVRFKNTTTDAGYLIGAAGDGRYNYVGIHSAFSGYGENWGSGAQYTGFSVPADTSNIHVIKVDLTSAPKFYLDSTLKATQDAYATITSTYTLRVNANVSGNSQRCSARYYDVKLSKNGSLVRDFVPAQHGNDVGMYDLANGQFYKDAKGGNFTAGPVVQ